MNLRGTDRKIMYFAFIPLRNRFPILITIVKRGHIVISKVWIFSLEEIHTFLRKTQWYDIMTERITLILTYLTGLQNMLSGILQANTFTFHFRVSMLNIFSAARHELQIEYIKLFHSTYYNNILVLHSLKRCTRRYNHAVS